MAILGKGPGPKKKDMPKSKIGGGTGRTVAAPGYAMGLIRNEKAIKEPTKKYTMGSGPAAVTRTQQQGIIGPKPLGPGGKSGAAAAPAPAKKKGRSAVGKVVKKIGRDIDYAVGTVAYNLRPSVQKRGTFKGNKGGRRGGGKTCPAY
jgi:hypothetical protein